MADVKFKKGLEANLPSAKEEGVFYVSTDTGSIHLDVDSNNRIKLNEIPEALPNPKKLTITGAASASYDGSSAVTVNIPTPTSVSGNAGTATKLAAEKTITLSGDVSGSVAFDGSKDVAITTTVADDSHNHIISNVDGLQSALDGKVPNSRTVNGKALSANISLVASDVGALPDTTEIPNALSDLTADSNHRTVTDAEKTTWNAKSNFSGSYNDLTNKPTIPSISGLATETYVDNAVSGKVDKVSGKGLSTNDYTSAEKTKLSGIATGAEVNQNAFSNVVVGGTTIAADAKTDSITVAAGTGISVTGDATNDKITITNSGVRSVSTGGTNGTISVNTNGTAAEVAVKGLGSAAYTASTAYDAAGTAQTKADAALASAKTYADGIKNDLLNGAGGAYDTLKELGDLIDDNADAIDALETVAAGKADKSHSHTVADVTGLQTALDGKAASSHGTHVSYSTTAPVMDGTASAGSASTVARSDHKHPIDTSRAAQSDLTAHTGNTTSHITSTERTNWGTAYTHSQAAHAPSNAEKNQNAFSNVAVGTTTIAADSATDTLTLVAGSNVTITPDATNDKITIAATDTKYTHPSTHAASMITGLATVATSGKYSDLSGQPTIPTKTSQLTNDSGFKTTDNNTTYSLSKSGSTITLTGSDGSTTSVTDSDTDTKYTHPSYTAKSSGLYKVTVDNTGHVSAATAVAKSDITALGIPAQDTTYSAATQSAAGLMSIDDKKKLDGITAGANKYTHPSYTAKSSGLYKVTVDSSGHVSGTTAVTKSDITGLGIPAQDTTYSNATTSADGLMSSEDKAKLDYTNVAYGTCSTAAATAAKVVALNGNSQWSLTNGSIIMVHFDNSNTASNVTLNVNGTGAYPIWYNNAEYTSNGTAYTGYANRVITYMFNGTHYVWITGSYDSNTTYTNVKLGHGYATCSTAAATAAKVGTLSSYTLTTGGIVAVKFTYDVPANATLNINSKGAKAIYHRGAKIAAGVIKAGDTATFIYSTYYHLISVDRDDNTTYSNATTSAAGLMSAADKTKLDGIATGATANTGTITGVSANGTSVATSGVANIPAASTSAYGVTKLSSATNSTSTVLAATASAVKAAYDLANSKAGTSVATTSANGLMSSSDKKKVDNLENIQVFDTFPSEDVINSMANWTVFRTRGFYHKDDGLACRYTVRNSAGGLRIPYGNMYIYPSYMSDNEKKDIYVDLYGVRRNDASYAVRNSEIMDALMESLVDRNENGEIIGGRQGYTIHFGSGYYYFANPIISNTSVCFKGTVSNAEISNASTNFGSYLHFAELADGEAAISLPGGVVQDLGIVGNPNISNVTLDRTKTITDPDSIVTLVDTGTTYGIKFNDMWSCVVQNVRLRNFTYGIYTPTGNGLISGVNARQCKIGVSVGNDMKLTDIQVWNVMVGAELRGVLASVSNLRGDSIGEHLVVCKYGKCVLSNIDGDYCIGSLIHYGNGDHKRIHLGQAVACMGRVATKYSFAADADFNLQNIPSEDYEYCSYISIAPNTKVFGGQIDIVNVASNPFDENAGQYYHPNAILSIAEGSTVKGLIIKCNVPYDADVAYFNSNVIKNLSTYAEPVSNGGSYITDFDGKTIEDVCFITPKGSIRSMRTVSNPDRKLDDVSTLFNKMDNFVEPFEVLVPGININNCTYEYGRFSVNTPGQEVTDDVITYSFRTAEYIPVEGGRTIAVYFDKDQWNNYDWGRPIRIVEYDSNKTAIVTAETNGYASDITYTLNSNTAYIRISNSLWDKEITTPLADIKIAVYYAEDAVKEFVEFGYDTEIMHGVQGEKVIYTSPNGTKFTLSVSDAGALSVVPLNPA